METRSNIITTIAHQSALSSITDYLMPMPACAHYVFHWAVVHDYPLPRPLHDRVVEIRIARIQIAHLFPENANNWLKLSEAEQFLGREQEYKNCMQWLKACEIPDSMSPQEVNSLLLQILRQEISYYMWKGDFRTARKYLDKLFANTEGGTLADLLLRAAFELHVSQGIAEDMMRSAELKASAIVDLEAAKSLDPEVIRVCLDSLRKDLEKTLTTLWKERGIVPSSVIFGEISKLASVLVRVDLSGGFHSASKRKVANLPLLSKDLESLFNGKTLTVGRLERGPTFPFFLVYKILRTSIHGQGILPSRSGIFTERTKLKLIPGDAVYSRSQSSILYAIGLHGIFGLAWAERFKKGICWGTAVTWLTRTMSGFGDEYFGSIDNAVRHKWDDGVKTLFHDFFSYQSSTTLGLSNWHLRAGLIRRQSNVFLHDPKILTEYISLLSGKNIGIICTCGEHAVSAVIRPSDNKYSLFYDSNEEQGDILVKSPKDLADQIVDAMIVEEPITIQVYVKS